MGGMSGKHKDVLNNVHDIIFRFVPFEAVNKRVIGESCTNESSSVPFITQIRIRI